MRLLLHEDRTAQEWEPFSLTRPIGELLYGAFRLRERLERAVGIPAHGYLAPHLDGFDEADACPSRVGLGDSVGPILVLSSRYLPPLPGEPGHQRLAEVLGGDPRTGRLVVDGSPVGWLADAAADLTTVAEAIRAGHADSDGDVGREIVLPGRVLSMPWDLMASNADRLASDLSAVFHAETNGPIEEDPRVARIGAGAVSTQGEVTIDPGCVLDTRDGPIHLGTGVHLRPFTYLRGPAIVGPGTTLFGGTFEALSVGPRCKLRGEISESVFLGYTNKAHDGYIGHSVVGRWVNLGAFTTNSDLKNNYGEIRVGAPEGDRDTGMIKVGVFLGDHVKTGIGTRLNGGTVVGAGSNLFGTGFPPKWVPAFHWGTGRDLVPHRVEAFLETAERAMARRDVSLSPAHRAFLGRAWERVHGTPS